MSLPGLSSAADTRSITERVNRLITDYNGRRSAVTVANLPPRPAIGETWMVSDANATGFNSIVTGGGSNVIGARWDGTHWRIC